MVYVPAGEFKMGSDDWLDDARPAHVVKLDTFWLDRTEVTMGQYWRCVQAGGCSMPAEEGADEWASDRDLDTHPMVFVNWYQARAYCLWAEARLPTEAEWEYAARGPRGLVYPWGNEWDIERLVVWPPNEGSFYMPSVGSHPNGASWCGALDMAGSVWEWVNDWYGPYPSEPEANPQGPESGTLKVIRGGSYENRLEQNRSDHRAYGDPDATRAAAVGFRCARSP